MDLLAALEELHVESIRLLAKRIKDGSATASDIAQAVALLKHNNISASRDEDTELREMQDQLAERRNKRKHLRVVNGADLEDIETYG